MRVKHCALDSAVAALAAAALGACDFYPAHQVRDVELVRQVDEIFRANPERPDFRTFDNGNWKIVCAVGGIGDKKRIREAVLAKGIGLGPKALDGLNVYKSSRQIIWLTKNDELRYVLSEDFYQSIQIGVVVCVTPDRPAMHFATELAIKASGK